MTITSARRAALSCALLATTAVCGLAASPAAAQSAPPPKFVQVDGNGVDLTNGEFFFSMIEGSIGAGEGAVSLTRTYAGSAGRYDNWTGAVYRRTSGGQTLAYVVLGGVSETFTISGSTYTSTKANGGTLVDEGGTYRYTAADGTRIDYIGSITGADGFTQHVLNGPECYAADAGTCAIPTQITRPNGMTFTLAWDFVEKCSGYDAEFACIDPRAYFRFRGVSSTAQYGFTVNYLTDSPGTSAEPHSNWNKKTGVVFSNAASPPAAAPTVAYAYPASNIEEVTDIAGRTWRFTTSNSKIIGIRRPGASSDTTTVVYNSTTGLVSSVTDHGVATNYTRSVSGNTGTMTVTNALSQQSVVTSDLAIGRPTAAKDPLNRTTGFAYDGSGRLTRTTAPEGNYVQMSYDQRGNVVETRAVAKPGSGLADIVTTASFDASCSSIVKCNKPNSTTDARGYTTDYSYDGTHGGLLSVTAPAAPNGVRPQTRIAYSQVGGVTLASGSSSCQTQTSCLGTADEVKTTTTYDTANLVPVSTTVGNGSGTLAATETMAYDGAGNLVTVDGPLPGAADTIRYRYSAGRERIGLIGADPDGTGPLKHRAQRTTINAAGQVVTTERGTVVSQYDADWSNFAALEAVEIGYDANFRATSQKLVAGGSTHAAAQTSYDALGRVECVAQRMNPGAFASLSDPACSLGVEGSFGPDRISKTVYDAAGQVTEQRSAVATSLEVAELTTTYRDNGEVETVTDAEKNRTTYEYDGHGRLLKTLYPLPTKGAGASNPADYEQQSYDAGGNRTSVRNRGGETIGFTYDGLGRLTLKDLPGNEPDVSYSHDLLGRLTSASQPGHVLTLTYDALGRPATQNGPTGTLAFTWDLAGRRTRLTHPDSFFVDYDHLVTGEVRAIRENGATSGVGVLASYTYDDLGRRTTLSRGNGSVASYGYDAASRLSQLADDLAGTAHDHSLAFTYNPAGQIIGRTASNDAYAFIEYGSGTTTSSANGLNQIAQQDGTSLVYDAKGNLLSEGARSYAYSSENLLVQAPGALAIAYDPLMRLSTYDGSKKFTMDGGNIVLETDAAGNVTGRQVWGPGTDELLAAYGTARVFAHTDERGSVTAGTLNDGSVHGVNKYDEYGNQHSTGRWGNTRYTGQAFLGGTTNLSYHKARWYNPGLGRFMQPDPIGYGDGMNMYGYVRGDPMNATDRSGTTTRPSDQQMAAYIAAGEAYAATAAETAYRPGYGGGDLMRNNMMDMLARAESAKVMYIPGHWEPVKTGTRSAPSGDGGGVVTGYRKWIPGYSMTIDYPQFAGNLSGGGQIGNVGRGSASQPSLQQCLRDVGGALVEGALDPVGVIANGAASVAVGAGESVRQYNKSSGGVMGNTKLAPPGGATSRFSIARAGGAIAAKAFVFGTALVAGGSALYTMATSENCRGK